MTPNLGVHTLAPPDRPVPPMAGTAAIGAVVHLPATVIKEGRDLSSSMSGLLADTAYHLRPATKPPKKTEMSAMIQVMPGQTRSAPRTGLRACMRSRQAGGAYA
ncbi:hypothetical protein [Streptomyces sp. NPDC060065]|uniref:hypothetical protein n=1 Tax=Streptomyces sp. NPDC060065 TaxID=3347050 RepID=UPI0036C84671